MSDDKTPDDYEVGYRKPPKHTRFQKGVSGNPKGRPKKALDFDHELIKESESLMTIKENCQQKRISKHAGVLKQLINNALKGNILAARTYLDPRQQALERAALLAGSQASDLGKDIKAEDLSDDQLAWIIAGGLEKANLESGKDHLSNTE